VTLDIQAPPPRVSGFVPIRRLYRIEHAFAGARSPAPPVALLRGHRGERQGLARGGVGRLPRLARRSLTGADPQAPGPRSPLARAVRPLRFGRRPTSGPRDPRADPDVRARRRPSTPRLVPGPTTGSNSATGPASL
jgi:hypothetical protein